MNRDTARAEKKPQCLFGGGEDRVSASFDPDDKQLVDLLTTSTILLRSVRATGTRSDCGENQQVLVQIGRACPAAEL